MTTYDFFLSDETVELFDGRILVREPTLAQLRASENAAANHELLRFAEHTKKHAAGLKMLRSGLRDLRKSDADNDADNDGDALVKSDQDYISTYGRTYDVDTLLQHCILRVDDASKPPAGKTWGTHLNSRTCAAIYATILKTFVLLD